MTQYLTYTQHQQTRECFNRKKQLEMNEASETGQWWDDALVDWDRYYIVGSGKTRLLFMYETSAPWKPADDKKEKCNRCGNILYYKPNGMDRHQKTRACRKLQTP